MNIYQKYYNNLIYRSKNRETLNEEYEIHHIVPRSFGGEDSENNLVKLTLKEHYFAHYLLYKITNSDKMLYALMIMSKNRIVLPKVYESIREKFLERIRTPIICLDEQIIFKSIREAAVWIYKNNKKSKLKSIEKNISSMINGKRKSCYGHVFSKYNKENKYEKLEKPKATNFSNNCKQIICLQNLKIYNNAREAERELNISYKSISRSCINKISTKGYGFRFYDKNVEYKKEEHKKIHKQTNKKIICLQTKEIFDSLQQLSKILKCSRSTIKKYIDNHSLYKNFNYEFLS